MNRFHQTFSHRSSSLSPKTLKARRKGMTLMELLEDRRLLSTYLVTTAADDGVGSLRQAILAANAVSGADTIDASGVAGQTIQLDSALPAITDQLSIYGGNSSQRVQLTRSLTATGAFSGLVIDAPHCVVEGLVISGFSGASAVGYGAWGIVVTGNGNYAQIKGNLIGTDADGLYAVPNSTGGILVDGATGVTIGGVDAADLNVISGNKGAGVLLQNAQGAKVLGNYIGTDINGQLGTGNVKKPGTTNVFGIGNEGNGIIIAGGGDNVIGGAAPNLISGNSGDGVRMGVLTDVKMPTSGNMIVGNYIGTDASHSLPLTNTGDGVSMYSLSSDNTILGNVVCGDGVSGLDPDGLSSYDGGLNGNGIAILTDAGASGNRIQGNYIGTNRDGDNGLGNGIEGILVSAAGATIKANVICNNYMGGIEIAGNSDVLGNWIGVMPDGTAMGNADDGVRIKGDGNSIAGNTIAYNSYGTDYGNGVNVVSGVNNSIRGNSIYSNQLLGIDLNGDGVTGNDTMGHDGPNLYQNFPEITNAVGSMVYFKLEAPAGTYWVDLYANSAPDPVSAVDPYGGYGEGQTYVGHVLVTTDGSGTEVFQARITNVPDGQTWITATASATVPNPDDADNPIATNTSEFSQAFSVESVTTTTTLASSRPEGSVYGQSVTFTAHVTTQNLLAGVPTGWVIFEDLTSMKTLAKIALDDSGDAVFTTGTLSAGTHTIVASYLGHVGFDASASSPLDQFVSPRAITITADAETKIYGDADPTLGYYVSSGSLVGGDSFTGSLVRAAGEDAGVFAIEQGGLALSNNYALSFVGANFSITRRAVTVTADAQTKVYGDGDPSLTYTITGGSLVNGDGFAGSLIRTDGRDVGTYAIEQGTLRLSSNYNLTFVGAGVTITQRHVTVTDPRTKVYGEADPTFSPTITEGSLAYQDQFTGSLTRDAGENVGDYTIRQGTLALGDNYILDFVPDTLTITPRPITVTATSAGKTYGEGGPALTYAITDGSLAYDDKFTGALSRAVGENAGKYAIGEGTLALGGNYTLTFVGADFVIAKADASVAVSGYGGGTYDGNAHTRTVTVTGVGGNVLFTTDLIGTNAGGYSKSWSFSNDNYNSSGESGTLSFDIGQADAHARVTAIAGLIYNGSLQTTTAGTATDVFGNALPASDFSLVATQHTNAGTYNGDTWSFSDLSGNYNSASGTVSDRIDKASSTTVVSINGGPFTYTGSAITPATVTVTGAGLSLTPDAVYANNVNAGTATASSIYGGDANHLGSSGSQTFTIAKASSTTTVTINGGPFACSGSAITPASATATGVGGLNQSLTVTYSNNVNAGTATASASYAGDANHNSSSDSKTFTINPAANPFSFSGTIRQDATGDGLSSDDPGLGGVTVTLYRDSNNNGALDGGDLIVGSTTSASDGTYSVAPATPASGRYFVQENVPSGYVRTAPASSTIGYYTVNAVQGNTYKSNDFDNFKVLPCPQNITNVSYTIDGTTTVTDLRGHVTQGDTVEMTFTVLTGKQAWISLVSYTAPGSGFDANVASQQQIFEVAGNVIYGPGTYTISVDAPNSYFQVDAVCGAPIAQFGPAGGNIFYSAEQRLLSADNGGTKAYVANSSSLSGYVYNDKDNDGAKESGELGIAGVTMSLLDKAGNLVATATTNSSGAYAFNNINPGIYTVSEAQPAGWVDGEETAGSLGGDDGGDNNVITSISVLSSQQGANYNFGELKEVDVTTGDAATIGFWQNKNGQNLIKGLNGSSCSHTLANWLVSNFPNIYGVGSANNLTGKANSDVAALFVKLFNAGGQKLDAQVMGVALAVYSTSSNLAGSTAAKYGFTVSTYGTGLRSYNVGSNGAAFGVANNTEMLVIDILGATNDQSVRGVLYNGNSALQAMANTVFNGINQQGDIS